MKKGINKAELNGNWNGGVWITNRGYRKILTPGHPRGGRDGYVLEHILVAEKKIGRLLEKGEVIHHVNGNKLDNRPENLMLFSSHSEHLKYEADLRGRKVTPVRCDTCGKLFNKRNAAVKEYNFCCRQHVNPSIWIH